MICSKYYLKLPGRLLDSFRKKVIDVKDSRIVIKEFRRLFSGDSWELDIIYQSEVACMQYERIISKFKRIARIKYGEVA